MRKIIEPGKKQFIIRCPQCDCRFSYEIDDICYSLVYCPNCNKSLDHNNREKQRNVKDIPSCNTKRAIRR